MSRHSVKIPAFPQHRKLGLRASAVVRLQRLLDALTPQRRDKIVVRRPHLPLMRSSDVP